MENGKIVITSIYSPSPAVKKFSGLSAYSVIVVGDKKTPVDWEQRGVDFVPWNDSRLIDSRLAELIPFNHYSRKNLGYLVAMKEKPSSIIDTDDDNLPLDDFGFPNLSFEGETTADNLGFINVYQHFSKKKIWPRGLPVLDILKEFRLTNTFNRSEIGIWQGLANGDPDVDALYRLTDNSECIFEEQEPLVLGSGTWSPFNSQNTLFRPELFPLLYLPSSVSFRFTDILRSFIAQPITWSQGYRLGFTKATVFQDRNPHDYLADLLSEVPMYRSAGELPTIMGEVDLPEKSILSALTNSYEKLLKHRIVLRKELDTLDAWVEECSALGFS